MLVLTSLVFLTIVLVIGGIFMMVTPTRVEQRLEAFTGPRERSDWTETITRLAGPLARLSAPDGDWDNSPLRLKFMRAGIRHPDARLIYFAAKTLLPLAFALGMYALLTAMNESGTLTLMLYLLMAALLGCYLPNLAVWLSVRSRQREVFENFPDAADLMLVCVEAGLGLDAGLTKVAEEMRHKSQALAEELHLTNLEIRNGGTREKALHNLAMRTGVEELGTFATMLTQADKFGTSIGDSLRVFSDDLRHKRQVRAEEAAAKVPTKLLFPLVTCIFPAVIMVILGPAIIQIIRNVLPMLSTGV
ncbi:MAG: type II secretion system F family protein [Ramlibacter sp.]|nr:type II secretion system F family protein [Ramlibacter sp.]